VLGKFEVKSSTHNFLAGGSKPPGLPGLPDSCVKLSSLGLSISFVDDWDSYHLLKGEVHCGTNTLRKTDPSKLWWETRV
jgi:hypothetical protein